MENGRYRLDRNARRQDNINLFLDYVINEAKVREIILSLTEMDFSGILRNEHKGFEHERLYVFGKDVILLERNGTEEKTVSLYIKFNKLDGCFVIVISFHEQAIRLHIIQMTRRRWEGAVGDRKMRRDFCIECRKRRENFAEEGHG